METAAASRAAEEETAILGLIFWSYIQRMVPIIDDWNRLNLGDESMQDKAPSHAAAETIAEMKERRIKVIN